MQPTMPITREGLLDETILGRPAQLLEGHEPDRLRIRQIGCEANILYRNMRIFPAIPIDRRTPLNRFAKTSS